MRHHDIKALLTEPHRHEVVNAIRTRRLARRIRKILQSPSAELLERIRQLQELEPR